VIAQFVADLAHEVSPARLGRYRPNGGSDLDMVVNYLWNMALAEALSPSLAALEIGVRNSIHDALTTFFGTEFWFFESTFVGNRKLKQELSRAIDRLGGPGSQPSSGRIVAEVHFFFWTTILSGYYHNTLWNPNRAAVLRAVFPHLHGPRFQRRLIHDRFNTIRLFRNRVMHHEPLLYGFALPGHQTISLATMHTSIIEAIGWSSPRLQASVVVLDRFPDVLANGRRDLETAVKTILGIP
jgi:hypothetical protein